MAMAVWAVSFIVVVACRSNSNGPATASTPCGDYFDALDANPCAAGPGLPGSEIARLRARFEQICVADESLPGSGLTDATLEACATAVQSAGCSGGSTTPEVCDIVGTLAGGTGCNEGFQCTSGACFLTAAPGEAGPAPSSCGQCLAIAQLGQPCTVACAPGATCDHGAATPTCVSITLGGVGADCNGVALQCEAGLYCNTAGTCEVLPAVGEPCTTNGLCAPPATCVGSTCQPLGTTGAACGEDQDCVPGLGCGQASQTCSPVTWGTAGQACGDLARCLVGDCDTETMTCPTVIDDGQPCSIDDPSTTCDTFARCTGGLCVLQDSQVCM
jgi:hypothetical protein